LPAGDLWDRLKNDLAFRVGTVYAGGSWFLVEALDTLGMAPAMVRRAALLLALGFLVVVPATWLLDRRARRRAAALAAATTPGAQAGVATTRRRGYRRWASAVVALCVVAAALWGLGMRASGSAVPEAATRLAVLPFHATGGDAVREYGVGMVNLLSAALDGVGGINTVPSQTVLARVGGDGAVMALAEHLRVGEQLGAGSVLTGTITAIGTQVSLAATIRETGTGAELATAEIRGAVDGILELTDELAVRLLRDLWRSNAPLPTVNVASLTTSSPAALSAYLSGESFLRRLQADSAFFFFERATELDSTFALAWVRLASAAGWIGDERADHRRQWVGRALALVDRLPEREAALVRAYGLFLDGSLAAIDSLERYVVRYPDDPLGHYELGDARFHVAHVGLHTSDQIIGPFLEATRLDPSLGLGLVHVLDMTLDQGDSASFRTALERFERVGAADRVASFRAEARVRWARPDSLLAIFAAELEPLDPSRDRREINQLVGALGNQVRLNPDVDPMAYIHAMDTILDRFGSDTYFRMRAHNLRRLHFGALGMADSAEVGLDRWLALNPPNMPPVPRSAARALLRVGMMLDGAVPADRVAGDVALLEQHLAQAPFLAAPLSEYYIRVGEPDRARPLTVAGTDNLPPDVVDTAAFQNVVGGWQQVVLGDTAAGIRRVDDGLTRIAGAPGMSGGPWREYAEVLTTMPSRRQQAIRILRWQTEHQAVNTGQSFLSLARALELDGDYAGARDAYQHVLRLWHLADSYRQPDIEQATAALTRLAAERGDTR
jgi:TolB-like protein